MKISKIDLFYNPNSVNQTKNTVSVPKSAENNNALENNMSKLEALGRSQVVFEGKKKNIKLCPNDQKFIEATSGTLRFSDEQTKKFKNVFEQYLAENKFKSIPEIHNDKLDSNVIKLQKKLEKNLDLSDADISIISYAIAERLKTSNEEYEPLPLPYEKDFEVVEDITLKYKVSSELTNDVFLTLTEEADLYGYPNIFDVFSKDKPLHNGVISSCIDKLAEEIPRDEAIDAVLDFINVSKMDEYTRHHQIDRHRKRDEFYNSVKTSVAAATIWSEYNLPWEQLKAIETTISERSEKTTKTGEVKSLEQIAHEITDTNNLPIGSEKHIVFIIKDTDNLDRDELDVLYKDMKAEALDMQEHSVQEKESKISALRMDKAGNVFDSVVLCEGIQDENGNYVDFDGNFVRFGLSDPLPDGSRKIFALRMDKDNKVVDSLELCNGSKDKYGNVMDEEGNIIYFGVTYTDDDNSVADDNNVDNDNDDAVDSYGDDDGDVIDDAELDEAYQDGFDDGHEEGFEKGFNEGYDKGYNDAISRFKDGKKDSNGNDNNPKGHNPLNDINSIDDIDFDSL